MNYKPKTFIKSSIIVSSLSFIVILSGCKKVETTKTATVTNTASQTAIAKDEVIINNAVDQYIDDAVAVLSNNNATIPGAYPPFSLGSGAFQISYDNKLEADSVEARQGVDSIHFNPSVSWGTIGATATLSFKDNNTNGPYELFFYTILLPRLPDSAGLVFTGGITVTNMSGVLLQNITATDSMVVSITTTNINYTFGDNVVPVVYFALNINEIRSYKLSGSTIIATTWGNTSTGGYSNVGSWGTDVFGNSFYSTITPTAPVVQNISNLALSYNPLSGTKIIQGISEPITCKYGLNSQGNVVTSGTPYGFSISWIDNGASATDVVPYYY